MKNNSELEAAVCDDMSQFATEYLGRGSTDINAYLIDDILVIRLQGVLTVAERYAVSTLSPTGGRDKLKQIRSQFIEIARADLEIMILKNTGVKPRSLHHDISTVTGEEVIIFTFAEFI